MLDLLNAAFWFSWTTALFCWKGLHTYKTPHWDGVVLGNTCILVPCIAVERPLNSDSETSAFQGAIMNNKGLAILMRTRMKPSNPSQPSRFPSAVKHFPLFLLRTRFTLCLFHFNSHLILLSTRCFPNYIFFNAMQSDLIVGGGIPCELVNLHCPFVFWFVSTDSQHQILQEH